ncbi:protein inscuteable homolog [Oppia nitens]|uniref:protein inscuteable homolog n=1 Tax=Oppia nitens TaxID=1686743 RepID=UPI0023DC76EB|nr:protein inscuteable homolog [Oppia nitens]
METKFIKSIESLEDKSIKEWLLSLQKSPEYECLSALSAKCVQNKNLNKNTADSDHHYNHQHYSAELMAIRQSHATVADIRRESARIIDTIDHFIDNCLPIQKWQRLQRIHDYCLRALFDRIRSVADMCRRKSFGGGDYTPTVGNKCLSADTLDCCSQLSRFVQSFVAKQSVNNAQLEATIRKLKELFGELVDQTIKSECSLITASIKNRNTYLTIEWSLMAYIQLTRDDAYLCRALVESSANQCNQSFVHLLVDLIANYCSYDLQESQQIKAGALTILTNLCVNHTDAIQQVMDECAANKSFIEDIILTNESSADDFVLRQAVQLVVQLTKQFIDDNNSGGSGADTDSNNNYSYHKMPVLWHTKHLTSDLINCLTQLVRHQTIADRHLFLLICTALANISFIAETNSVFIKYRTCDLLLAKVRDNSQTFGSDIQIKDQLITILANIGRKLPEKVVECNGLVFVLCALQVRPVGNLHDIPELLAVERIQQKCCVCLSRLANDRTIGRLIARLNGVHRLTELCKLAKERNFSDTVLLAAIVCLRKLSASVDKQLFKQLDATDLIEPKAYQTFLMYSERNETVV